MNRPRQDRAAKHLQSWLAYKPDLAITDQGRANFLKTFFEKADEDFADCSSDHHYRTVWVAVSGGFWSTSIVWTLKAQRCGLSTTTF